jgi:hypothetical protein
MYKTALGALFYGIFKRLLHHYYTIFKTAGGERMPRKNLELLIKRSYKVDLFDYSLDRLRIKD